LTRPDEGRSIVIVQGRNFRQQRKTSFVGLVE
jgi:hypothetical protein